MPARHRVPETARPSSPLLGETRRYRRGRIRSPARPIGPTQGRHTTQLRRGRCRPPLKARLPQGRECIGLEVTLKGCTSSALGHQPPRPSRPKGWGGGRAGTQDGLPAPPRAASCQSLPAHPHPPHCARPRAGHSLRAPPCQHAFPHRGPCLPAWPPRSHLPQERARSVLDSCSVCCLSRLRPRGLPGENRPKHGNRGVVTVPPPAPGPGDKDDSPSVSSRGCWEATRPGQ